MLPYFLFSALAGQLADKYDKAMLARRIKLFDIAAMIFGVISLWLNNPFIFLAFCSLQERSPPSSVRSSMASFRNI